MSTISGAEFGSLFREMAAQIETHKDHLSVLDSVIGDGDHGVTMSIGFQAINKALDDLNANATPADVFMTCAKTFLNAVGASVGPLYATAFMRAAARVKDKAAIDEAELADILVAMSAGIIQRGKAALGQKTMVDAWHPAAQAAREAKGEGHAAAIASQAAKAAEVGAQSTAEMTAGKGRSANLGDRAIGHVDPGAASAALLIRTIADWAQARSEAQNRFDGNR
jgi:dihydroxyacetone kinase-like protein